VAVAWLLARVLQRRLNIKELAVQTVAQKPGQRKEAAGRTL